MRIPLCTLGLILSGSMAIAQTAQQTQAPPPVNPTTPATQVGDGSQSKSGTPVAPTSQAPASSATAPSATGGVAGSASSTMVQSPEVQTADQNGVNAMANSDLQGQIQGALTKEPTLTGDSPNVTVTGDTIELNGNVATNKEKITATRIVQSYSGSKKLVNNLNVVGRGDRSSSSHTASPTGDRQPISAPTNNPEPEKGSAPSAQKPPQQ